MINDTKCKIEFDIKYDAVTYFIVTVKLEVEK